MMNDRTRSRILYSALLVASFATMRCASGKQNAQNPEPVAPAAAGAKTETGSATTDSSLPPELRDVNNYDPAASIDPAAVQNSDFYQVKKAAETNRPNLEKDWKAQDDQEDAVKKAKEAEKLKKQQEEKKEEETREQARLKSVRDYKAQAADRARYMREADQRVKKMPTITREDVLWNGLED